MKAKPNRIVGLDNFERSPDEETRLNFIFESVFKTDAGAEVLKYLRMITIEAVAGSEISDQQLRHIEGQRYIVGLIQRRLNKGRSQNIIQEKKDVR
ncbi:MAG: hypothetical protein CML86_07475 [Rhodobiaceae bacterium]|nr:hypothetical protein [Rhodobiaceae bacterium]|tara:strand:+ start:721 stop:1008 length:288 start_codon:yes stop_codon:yes gene_type:complete